MFPTEGEGRGGNVCGRHAQSPREEQEEQKETEGEATCHHGLVTD